MEHFLTWVSRKRERERVSEKIPRRKKTKKVCYHDIFMISYFGLFCVNLCASDFESFMAYGKCEIAQVSLFWVNFVEALVNIPYSFVSFLVKVASNETTRDE